MREVKDLHPRLQAKCMQLIDICKKEGLIIGISECVRTKAEQDALYAKGRTAPGSIVTNVRYPNSCHCWGIAFDFYRNDGKGAYNDSDGFFTKVGEIGQLIGLEWGGSWKSIVDKPHFQLPDWGSTPKKLISEYKTFENFKKSWKPVQFEKNKKYSFLIEGYLRDKVEGNKIKYSDLSAKVKDLCTNEKGFAKVRAGSEFTLTEYRSIDGNIWGKTKSGYFVAVKYNATYRVKL